MIKTPTPHSMKTKNSHLGHQKIIFMEPHIVAEEWTLILNIYNVKKKELMDHESMVPTGLV